MTAGAWEQPAFAFLTSVKLTAADAFVPSYGCPPRQSGAFFPSSPDLSGSECTSESVSESNPF
jgi:hypothetical protein